MARTLLSPSTARHLMCTFQLKALNIITTLVGHFIDCFTAAQVFTVVRTAHMDTL